MRQPTRAINFSAPAVSFTILDGFVPPQPEEIVDTRVSLDEHEAALDASYKKGAQEATDSLTKQILDQRAEIAHLQEKLFTSVAEQANALTHQVSEMLPDLVIEISRRVLAGIEPDQAVVKKIITETLAEIAPGSAEVEVLLHPQDLALVGGIDKEFEQKYPGIKFSADPELTPGDCRAKSRFGTIDARVFTKLQNMGRSLK